MTKNEKQSSTSSLKTSIVFMGSGPVAAASLSLLSKTFDIEAVITKPTTEKEMTMESSSPVHTVSSRSELDILIEQNQFSSSVAVLIDFGIIVSQQVLDYFEYGIINSHFSLLPELRGADPISFAILEGKEETGVSLMLLVEAMDEGPLLDKKSLRIEETDTTPSLTDKLIQLSYSMLCETLDEYLQGSIAAQEQSGLSSYTRKLTKADGVIDWSKPADVLQREIRAFSGWPKSTTNFDGIDCVLLSSSVIDKYGESGTLFIHDKELAVHCGDKSLVIHTLKPAGKKAMPSQAFLAGYRSRLSL